jgi:A/G-specific adenine glycosylase
MKTTSPDPEALLIWYDANRRDLPWRAKSGEVPDPYRVWLSEIMLQQTTVTAVKPYFMAFLERFPDIEALAHAPLESVLQLWAGLGYYSRARNLHLCAQYIVARGVFPQNTKALQALPGIGVYTAGAIAAIAFNKRAVALDGNGERIFSRLDALEIPLPQARPLLRTRVQALVPVERPGDFAQALMDLGSLVCTRTSPVCRSCPWRTACHAHQQGTMTLYPKKAPKPVRPLRRGAAFVAVRADGAVLLRTRPPSGLLGGMSEMPMSDWTEIFDPATAWHDAPLQAVWQLITSPVRHVFTHFTLELVVYRADVEPFMLVPDTLRWVTPEALPNEPLPGLMRKVLLHAGIVL